MSVHGTANGVKFSITRSKTASKTALVFVYDGEDKTTQAVKETQAIIEEVLGINPQILVRTMFYGQHGLNQLLEASDAKLKDELSLIVPLSVWHDALSNARKQARKASQKATELAGMISIRSQDVKSLREKVTISESDLVTQQTILDGLQAGEEETRKEGVSHVGTHFDLETLEETVRLTNRAVSELESKMAACISGRDDAVGKCTARVDDLLAQASNGKDEVRLVESAKDACAVKLEVAEGRMIALGEMWGIDLESGVPETITLPDLCPTCHQDISRPGEGHDHSALRESVASQIRAAASDVHSAKHEINRCEKKLAEARHAKELVESHLSTARQDLLDEISLRDSDLKRMRQDLDEARQAERRLSEEFAIAAQQMQTLSVSQNRKSEIAVQVERVRSAKAAVEAASREWRDVETSIEKLKRSKTTESSMSELMGELVDAFGQQGVEAFVLKSAVEMLEVISQSYLDRLGEGVLRLGLSLESGERISRRAFVRGSDGVYKERPLAALSGGQYRRCSLALALGYSHLVAQRGRFHTSLIVMDEPLTHLDRAGRSDVGKLLRSLLRRQSEIFEGSGFDFHVSSVLIILQDLAAEELEAAFDCIDDVVMRDGVSTVKVDGPDT